MEHRALRLANGLHAVLVPRRTTPLVTVWVRYHVGSADDPPEQRGLAHLVEHLLFGGSRHTYRAGAWEHLYAARALGANATTGARSTDYFATAPAENLERLLWLESDRMGFMRGQVTRSEVALSRDVVAAELKIHQDDPRTRMSERVNNAVYPSPHPYFIPADASPLAGVEVATVEAFLARWVVPANAELVITGDVPEATAGMVERYFGELPGGVRPTRAAVPGSPLTEEMRLTEVLPGPAVVKVGWASPALWTAGDAAADVAATLLEDNPMGRLWAEDGPVALLEAHQASREGGSLFMVTATGRPGVRAAEVLATIDAAVQGLARVSAEDVAGAVRRLRVGLLEERGSQMALAGQVQRHRASLGVADGMEAAVSRYAAVRPVEVAGLVAELAGRRAVLLAEPGGGR